jgi:gamma-glutamylaminecyclotransferase
MIAGAGFGRQVIGELYAVDRAGLEQMDRLERIDLPDGYRRHCITVDRVAAPAPDSRDVFVYLKAPDRVNDLRSGELENYTPEAARLYRKRTDNAAIGEHDHDRGHD